MPITNGYTTLTDFKNWFGITDTDAARDAAIEAFIQDVSREIDAACFRQFYAAASSVRYFTAKSGKRLFIDDCTSVSAVATDLDGSLTYATVWAATDYRTMPANVAPITWLETKPFGTYSFDCEVNGNKVTAVWGYCATGAHPEPIRRACLIQAGLYHRRAGTVYSVAGGESVVNQGETKTGLLPEGREVIAPYVKTRGG